MSLAPDLQIVPPPFARKRRTQPPAAAPTAISGRPIVRAFELIPERPWLEVGSMVRWEGRKYVVDGLELVGDTWIAELIRPDDFLQFHRVGWCVPAEDLALDEAI